MEEPIKNIHKQLEVMYDAMDAVRVSLDIMQANYEDLEGELQAVEEEHAEYRSQHED